MLAHSLCLPKACLNLYYTSSSSPPIPGPGGLHFHWGKLSGLYFSRKNLLPDLVVITLPRMGGKWRRTNKNKKPHRLKYVYHSMIWKFIFSSLPETFFLLIHIKEQWVKLMSVTGIMIKEIYSECKEKRWDLRGFLRGEFPSLFCGIIDLN